MLEWNLTLDSLKNAWTDLKILARAKSGTLVPKAGRRGFNIDTKQAEKLREFGRASIQPVQWNC